MLHIYEEKYNAEANGAWCAIIVHENGIGYRGNFLFETGAAREPYGENWKAFCEDVRKKTGISLLPRNSMNFYKLSDYEQVAGLDAAHVRGDCRVTKKEIFVRGWRPETAILDVM